MPKLLDYIKEKGLSHEQVIEFLDGMENSEEELEESEEEPLDEEEDDEVEEDDTSDTTDDDDKPKMIQLSEDMLKKLIKEAVEESKKAKLKAPSKRSKKVEGKPLKPEHRSREDQFEVMF